MMHPILRCFSSLQIRSAEAGDTARLIPIGSVADHRIRAGDRKIEHRRTIDGNPETAEVIGDQPGAEPGGCRGLRVRQQPEAAGRGIATPLRRAEARHSSALLIDQDRRVIAADRLTQRSDEISDPRGIAAVAAEKDEANRISGTKEAAFFGAQLFPGAAQNDRTRRFPRRTAYLTGQ